MAIYISGQLPRAGGQEEARMGLAEVQRAANAQAHRRKRREEGQRSWGTSARTVEVPQADDARPVKDVRDPLPTSSGR
jgi:hypothetical protein